MPFTWKSIYALYRKMWKEAFDIEITSKIKKLQSKDSNKNIVNLFWLKC